MMCTTIWTSAAPGIKKTPVGVLSTVGTWHRRAPGYSLRHLEALVQGFAPDILCAEINHTDWETGHLPGFPLEYRECLIPLCRELDVIVVPVGDRWHGLPSPLRLMLMLGSGPRWINSTTVDWWHRVWAQVCSSSEQPNCELVEHILEAVQRDPGRRVLVTVRIERRYAVIDGLRQADKVTLVPVEMSPR